MGFLVSNEDVYMRKAITRRDPADNLPIPVVYGYYVPGVE